LEELLLGLVSYWHEISTKAKETAYLIKYKSQITCRRLVPCTKNTREHVVTSMTVNITSMRGSAVTSTMKKKRK
tara:strand:- start:420 stop:641 length:222 start_codon:yes stop_codon:yes gene_type:complete